jgi:rhodanese-related sulfurtransferase
MVLLSKGQNVIGFNTMVNTLITNDVDTVSREGLQAMIADGEVVLLDARESNEYAVSHIENAEFVGYDSFNLDSVKDIPKDKPVVVYCSVGYRSGLVAKQLVEAGYNNVFNLYGGIFDWTNHGLPVVNENNERVEQIHPYNSIWGIWVNKYEKRYEP